MLAQQSPQLRVLRDELEDLRPAEMKVVSHMHNVLSVMTALNPTWERVRARRRRGDSRLIWEAVRVPSASRIAHAGLAFAHPMSEAAVDAAIAALPLPREPLVLDTGCGNGEVLLRTLRAHATARGLGVDLDADAITEARERGAGLPVQFEVRDAASVEGRFDAVINIASSHAHGGFPGALGALRRLGPVLMYGEGFWRRPPAADFLQALGGATEDELADLDGLHRAVAAAGFAVVHESVAGDQDWAHYEETLAANAERHGTPDALAYARQIRERRALSGGTDTLGFALLVLRSA